MPALALDDEQRTAIIAASHLVPPRWRRTFLDIAIDQLLCNPAPTAKDITAAISVARRAAIGIGPPSMS
jgi:hypothetical protein